VIVGGPWWWGGYPYGYPYAYPYAYPYGYPYPYYYPAPYAAYPPVATDPGPSEYIEQPVEPSAGGYWYYCSSSQAYYPTVQTCSEAWIRVLPRLK